MECIQGLQHIGLPVNDSKKTRAFYESLGFNVVYETDNGDEHVVFLEQKGLVLETYQNGRAAMVDGAWNHVALDVDDVEAALREREKLGYLPLEGSIQFLPFFGKGVRFFTILGPDHEKIEFNQKL